MAQDEAAESKAWLSLDEAARRIGTSRAYVWMLCEHGRLGEVAQSADGADRRVQLTAVDAYLATAPKHRRDLVTLQDDAKAAGMYDIPESEYAGYRRTSDEDDKERQRVVERAQTRLVWATAVVVAICTAVAVAANLLLK